MLGVIAGQTASVKVFQVVDIAVARYAAITGAVEFTASVAGTPAVVGFFLGREGIIYTFTHEGREYIIGTMKETVLPSAGTVKAENLPTWADFLGNWDAYVFVGPPPTGTIRTAPRSGRVIGLDKVDVAAYLLTYDAKWFTGVLTVATPIELQPGGNVVIWTGAPTSVADALGDCIAYVTIFYMFDETQGIWVAKPYSWVIPTGQICSIVVNRVCTVTGFVWYG